MLTHMTLWIQCQVLGPNLFLTGVRLRMKVAGGNPTFETEKIAPWSSR